MAQTVAMVNALKSVLKARGVTYAVLARRLGLSEASVKRIFASRTFTLQRLDQICDVLGIEMSDLARMVRHERESADRLTPEQETALVSDPALLVIAVSAVNHWTFEEMVGHYKLSRAEGIRHLARLDRLGIIELLPDNRIRVRLPRNFSWLPDGPIQRFFQARLQNDYFQSRFDGAGETMFFVSGMLSRSSNALVQRRLRQISAEFSDLHRQDLDLPLSERSGTGLLLAIRPWVPESFKRMQRSPEGK